MKTARVQAWAHALAGTAVLGVLGAGAAGLIPGGADLSVVAAIVCLLGSGAAICLLLRRLIDADDRVRELDARLQRAESVRRQAEGMLAETQCVLSKLVRHHDGIRDDERSRLARDIRDDLGQALVSLRIELSLLQVSSNGIHPAVHQKTTAMIATLDGALGALRAAIDGLQPLGTGATAGDG